MIYQQTTSNIATRMDFYIIWWTVVWLSKSRWATLFYSTHLCVTVHAISASLCTPP